MKKLVIQSLVAISIAAALVGCGGAAERRADQTATGRSKPVTVKGSDTMVILGQRLAEEFMKANPATVVQVNGGGSGTGIAALINGTVDLAQASRAMTPDEREKVQQNRGSAVVEVPVAIDALAVFVHSSNAVQSLTMEQLKQIYQGQITNWAQLGGASAEIILYGRESSSGTYDYFREHVLNKEDFAPRVQTLQGTAAIINAVAKDPAGIGYGGFAYANDVKLLPISAVGSGPVAPGVESVASGEYPLARFLYLYHTENAGESVKSFVEFATSPEGQSVVDTVGYFPLNDAPPGETQTETAAPAVNGTNVQ